MAKDIASLQHASVPINDTGMVFVLDTGAAIDSEAEAMLQALHSRSTGGLQNHLKILAEKGAEKFMASFYVGYGHKSIGDCGSVTIFIEGVSMLVAKAVQDWPLYSGQEASTRYVDFQKQPFINPLGTKAGAEILERWRTFYVNAMEPVRASLRERFPRQDGEDEKVYEKAIAARVFDMLRSTLPAGAATNLAWHTNLRQAADKLMLLRHHPLLEVRQTAEAIEKALQIRFPSSFGHKRYDATETYNSFLMKNDYYFHQSEYPDFAVVQNDIHRSLLNKEILAQRPAKTELPKYIGESGTITFAFTLDFGSFRDLQRHRALVQRMPLLTTDLGFGEWYLQELPVAIREQLIELLAQQEAAIAKLKATPEDRQYYIAMGYKTANRVTGNLSALVYLVELRATRFVHPTLRHRAQQIAQYLEKEFGQNGLILHLDKEPDRFDIKRGEHDIQLKEKVVT